MKSSEVDPPLSLAISGGVALDFMFRPYLDSESRRWLDARMEAKTGDVDQVLASELIEGFVPIAQSEALYHHLKMLAIFVDPDDDAVLKGPIKRFMEVHMPSAGRSEGNINRTDTLPFVDAEDFSLPDRSSTLFFDAHSSLMPED